MRGASENFTKPIIESIYVKYFQKDGQKDVFQGLFLRFAPKWAFWRQKTSFFGEKRHFSLNIVKRRNSSSNDVKCGEYK